MCCIKFEKFIARCLLSMQKYMQILIAAGKGAIKKAHKPKIYVLFVALNLGYEFLSKCCVNLDN